MFVSICLALLCYNAAGYTMKTEMLPGEKWWGGTDRPDAWKINGTKTVPYDNASEVSILLTEENYGNHAVPFLVSSKGRYIWSEKPFDIRISGGSIVAEGSGRIDVVQAGATLKDAYQAAARRHFPSDGTIPPEEFITRPQYNTWIELVYNQNQKDIIAYAESIIANGFPAGGVLMIDDNWQKYYGNYEFKPDRFPDPKAMCDRLHELGFKVMLWVCPFVSPDSPEYRILRQKGLLMTDKESEEPAIVLWWNGRSAQYDMSNPATRDYVISTLKGVQAAYGVDGFKFDAGDSRRSLEKDLTVYDGKSYGEEQTRLWAELGLAFPYNEFRAAWKMGGKPLVFRLADKEYSWEGVGKLLPDMISAGITGHQCVCPDMIGGGEFTTFLDVDPEKFNQELIVRSCQIHALMPMMQFSVAPWRILSKENTDICRRAAELHCELGPYLVEQARKSDPLVRPMDYSFPGEGFESCVDQYMLGDKYLVAPMTVSGTVRDVKLPKGVWYDETGRRYRGGRTYTIDVPLDRIPVFHR